MDTHTVTSPSPLFTCALPPPYNPSYSLAYLYITSIPGLQEAPLLLFYSRGHRSLLFSISRQEPQAMLAAHSISYVLR